MTVFSFVGNVGSGKTLMTTIMACFDSHFINRTIFANYEINLPQWKSLKPEMLNPSIEPSLVILDEAYTWLESRQSGTPIHLYMSYILFQSRKRGMDFILTDQIEGVIDTRYRQMIDYNIVCQSTQNGFEYYIFERGIHGWAEPTVLLLPFEVAELFYPIYDSWELINPIDDQLLFKVSSDKGDTIAVVDEIVEKLLSKAEAKRITKGVVADFCLRNGYANYLVPLAYNSIKVRAIGADI